MSKFNVSLKTKNVKKPNINSKSIIFYLKRDWMLYLFLVIPMAFLYLFFYKPMYGLTIAFKDYDVVRTISESPWIGFSIFKEVFTTKEFYIVLRNTLMLNILDLITGFPTPIILAILLNEIRVKWFKRASQTLMYLPYFLSWVIISGIALQLFSTESGLINNLIGSMGLDKVPFLTEPLHWIVTYNAIGVWQSAGWGTIIYLAAITGINSELYEAAVVDGAGRLRKIWHITLPGIKATIIVLLIINVGRITGSSFERPFNLMNPLVTDVADVISTYVFRVGVQSVRYNLATAVGLFQSVVGFVLVMITNYASKKAGEQGIV